jgi:hypothetical protein
MYAEIVGFATPKAGSSAAEWEDAARFQERWGKGSARVAVVDGATEAFDVARWARQLVEGFIPDVTSDVPAPTIDRESMVRWMADMQTHWDERAPTEFATYIEAEKFRRHGAYATLVGFQLDGLHQPGGSLSWEAVAVGDSVLFQVRDGREIARFPDLGPDDFGTTPDLISTKPSALDNMASYLQFATGQARPDDVFLLATDALAQWTTRLVRDGRTCVWPVLSGIDADGLVALVDDQRATGELQDDDVTLVRVRVSR